jgi:hypothetical protein
MHTSFPQFSDDALYGLPGDIVRAISPHSEADPAALLLQTLVFFGNCIGRTAYFLAEDDRHYTILYALLVGETSKARKGTSLGRIRRVFRDVDSGWIKNRIATGLSSGEGLIDAVRDDDFPVTIENANGTVDKSTIDQRLLVLASEFSSVLGVMSREGNTLSAMIRDAWDSSPLQTLTRSNPARSTGAHISIIGHITREELQRRLTDTDRANGFANRFLIAATRRSQLLPEGGALEDVICDDLAKRLCLAVEHAKNMGEMKRDDEARLRWYEIYEELSAGHPGLVGAVTSRGEAQVMRLACVHALLDCSSVICRTHMDAAYALWQYCDASAQYIFGQATGNTLMDDIFRALQKAGSDGLTKTQVNNLFAGHQKSEAIKHALDNLTKSERVSCQENKTRGRPRQRWFAKPAEKAEEAEEVKAPSTKSAYSAFSANAKSPIDLVSAQEVICRAMNEQII